MLICALLLPATAPAAARAQEEPQEGTPQAADAWTPALTPFSGPKEKLHRNVSTETRNRLLAECWPGFLCVAAGEGDGQHSVWELYYCTERSLSDFLGAGAVTNSQGGNASARLLRQDRSVYMTVPADYRVPKRVDPWDPVWYIDVC
ncbi:hypothetical protein [Nonomuraea gerenzanensis]|uniref:Uncharacterized protein n=1 Tax=Nonomuraea gerenzanensis TaxID=93944 RepID=A0A1M4ECA0_9ACTN|nr:hypothetical protein [Nonomuraea gerenzanensis]UBU18676.1 hypothetical protein LCN96_27775 [Nonomuraea gerenzanensis]SBO96535.1 hypothetical protein BN4615_P6051 [Nonomuraea gerenzanensis]